MGSRKPTSSFDRFQCFYSWGWKCFKWSYILGKSIYDYCKDLYWLSCCIAKRLKKNGMAHFPSIPTPQSLLQVFWARRECWNFIWWSQVSIIQSTYFFLYLGKHFITSPLPSRPYKWLTWGAARRVYAAVDCPFQAKRLCQQGQGCLPNILSSFFIPL